MRQMQGVLWTKGVLLNPQHLQAQDRYLEDKLGFHFSALTHAPWGFVELEMDDEALAGGEVRLERAAGLLPDGLVFDIPAADDGPAPRGLKSHWRPDQTAMLVQLAIPGLRVGGRNVATEADDRSARFSTQVLAMPDENTGRAEKDILVTRKNFRLLLERESVEGSTAVPVARILKSEAGELRFDPDFVPPVIDISASRYLLSVTKRLVEILAAKSEELSSMRRQQNRSLAEFGRSDVGHFWLLYTVNTHLPILRHLYEARKTPEGSPGRGRARRGHPVDLYRVLTELSGTLMTFSPSLHPRDLPAYDHLQLSETFASLDETLRELLETAIPSNCVTLPLEPDGKRIWATSLDEEREREAVQAYLAVDADMDQARLIEKVPDLVKVGSRDQIRELLNQALPGVGLTHQPSPPDSLTVKMGCQYFRLEASGPRWASILQTRTLAAWVASEIPDPTLELVLLLPPEREGD